MSNKIFYYLLLLVFLIGFFLRFYKLGEVPNGLYQDETAIGYNAYSIITTGKDEYGKTFPLYFKSFGDYKLPVYIYMDTIPIYFLGLTSLAVRLPSAIFGFFTLIVFFFLVKELSKNKYLALLASGMLSVNPWHIHYSRATFEVSISLFLFALGYLCLHTYFQKQKKGMLVLGTFLFITSLYSYNLTRILSPLLYVLILYYNRDKKNLLKRKEVITACIVSFILLLPFAVTLLQKGGVSSASGTLIFSSAAVKAPLLEMRSYLIETPDWFAKLFFNMPILTMWQYIKNVFSYFSVNFFFILGPTHGNHGIGTNGLFYLLELPLIVVGIITSIKNKNKWTYIFLSWIFITIAVASLTRDIPHATRSFFLIVPLEIFSAIGLLYVYTWIKNGKNKIIQSVTFLVLCCFFAYCIAYYLTSYYVRFPVEYAKQWRQQDKDLSLFLSQQKNYSKIIIDKDSGFIYSSLLFYSKYNPSYFQKNAIREKDDSEGFSMVSAFDKYEFRSIDWSKDSKRKNTLIVTALDRKPKEIPSLKTFYYPTRPVVIALKQEIVEFPVADVAYVVVESK